MAVYLVTWDLNRQQPNYSEARNRLIEHLSRYETIRDANLDSVWFVRSQADSTTLMTDIRRAMTDNDRLFVTKLVNGEYHGWLEQRVGNWIDQRI